VLNDPSCIEAQSGGLDDSMGPSQPDLILSSEDGTALDAAQPPDSDAHHDLLEDSPHNPPALPSGDIEDLWLQDHIHLADLKLTMDFVKSLQQATLNDPSLGLSEEALEHLHNPLHRQPCDALNDDTHMAINLYLGNPSEATYKTNHAIILHCFPDTELPSYYKSKSLVSDLTGVELVVHDMCINSCIVFTGPFLELDTCPLCSEP
jgi:hypothetical protein